MTNTQQGGYTYLLLVELYGRVGIFYNHQYLFYETF